MTIVRTAPAISVVIPMYNSAKWIGGALDCVLSQTCRDYEIIVVDDGSTDDGAEIVARYGDPRITLISQSNRGLAGARNTGIRNARGRYVALLDADDRWHPDKLAEHVAHLDKYADIDVGFCWSKLIDENGCELGLTQRPPKGPIDAKTIFCRNPVGNGSAAVIRRTFLDRIEFAHPVAGYPCWFDEAFRQSEDIECWTRMALVADARFECIEKELTHYRISAEGLSADTSRQFETWRRFRDKIKAIDPAFVKNAGPLAEAYQRRYLARRCIIAGDGVQAARQMFKAMRLAPQILVLEPSRTLATLAGTLAALLIPVNYLKSMLLQSGAGFQLSPKSHIEGGKQ